VKPQVVFYDVHALDQQVYHDRLSETFALEMVEGPLSAETVGVAAKAEVISVHTSSPVTADIMKQLPGLKHVACRSTGFDHVDLAYAAAHGITVSTVPSYGDATVAEYAFLMLLAVSRRLMQSAHSVHVGLSAPEKLTGYDLNGKTIGVIGTGRIGRHAIQIAKGFGLHAVAYDVKPNETAASELGFTYVSFEELLGRADIITLHAPATPETQHLLDAKAFAAAKDGVIIVNTARGSLIDTPALIQALDSGKVRGAGLDVLEGEEYLQLQPELHLLGTTTLDTAAKQVLAIDILHKMPNVLLTHHNAFNSHEALGRIRDTTITNLEAWKSGAPQNIVTT
jgi:D-lactate dehydrogenase